MKNIRHDWFHLFKNGKESVFREIFEKYYQSILYYAFKILNSDDLLAEDIVIDSFRKAWEEHEKFINQRHLENFLYLVTRNACITYLRGDKVRQRTLQELIVLTEGDIVEIDLDLEKVQTELIKIIYERLKKMPKGYIIRMAYIDGKSTKEIAEELNMTENAVYIYKSRALKTLKSVFTKYHF